jgi:hypothetical protein
MSWNATKRATGWGYTNLYWYRDGIRRLGSSEVTDRGCTTDPRDRGREEAEMSEFSRFAWALVLVWTSPAQSADFSVAQVRAIVAAATADKPADLSGKSLENLDLSNLDLRRGNLSGANFLARNSTVQIFLAQTCPAQSSILPGSCGQISPGPICRMRVSLAS